MVQATTRPMEQARYQAQNQPQYAGYRQSTDESVGDRPTSYQPASYQQAGHQTTRYEARGYEARSYWQDFTIGLVGGAVGVLAMDLFRVYISPQIMPDENGQGAKGNTRGGQGGTQGEDDSISLVGQHHRPDESSTAALGRMMYHAVEAHDPDKKTKAELSNLVHWSYGVLQGGVYGVMQPALGNNVLMSGALFGTGLWLLGDELAVPLLGLQDGPGAAPPSTHVNRLALHLAYGITTAATTQLLKRMT